jgi:hypothetical protein
MQPAPEFVDEETTVKRVPLLEDLKTLLASAELAESARAAIKGAYLAQPPAAALLVEVGTNAKLGLYRTLALALKADWEAYEYARRQRDRLQEEQNRRREELAGRQPGYDVVTMSSPPLNR